MKILLTFSLFCFYLTCLGQASQDKVFMVDRSIKEGSVISIDESQIIFEEKSNPGTRVPIRLAIIWKIIYSNGFEEVFNQPLPENLVISEDNPLENSSSEQGGFFAGLSAKQDWRPVLSADLGVLSPIIIGPEQWTSTEKGLALRFGFGGEFGVTFNPLKNLGVSLSQGYTNHISYLPEIALNDSVSLEKEEIKLTSLPTTIKVNYYPRKDLVISGGFIASSSSISNSNPEVKNQRLSGYVLGLGKLFHMGSKKNYFELSLNYNSLSSPEPFVFVLDTEKFSQFEDLVLEFSDLNYIELKLKYHFGIIN